MSGLSTAHRPAERQASQDTVGASRPRRRLARPDRLERALHPGAWWMWALGLATAVSRTTNPLLLLLVLGALGLVVAARRTDAPWARAYRSYLMLGLVVIGIRVVFRVLLGAPVGMHVLVTLPEVPLPAAVAGIRLGGPVTAEGLLAAVYDGLRLATLLACLGAANALADPKRLLKSVPGALAEIGTTVVVALSVAPQLVESVQRVRRARRLRGGGGRGLRALRPLLMPVFEDALDRSLALAAAMDSRGYGRSAAVSPAQRSRTGALLIAGLCGVTLGVYGLLDGTAPRALGVPMLAVGVALATAGLALSARRVRRTVYRADRWRLAETVVALVGVAVAVVLVLTSSVEPEQLVPSLQPLSWPELPLLPALAVCLGALPAWLAPPPVGAGHP